MDKKNIPIIECPECHKGIRANAVPRHLSFHENAGGLSAEGRSMLDSYLAKRAERKEANRASVESKGSPCRCCGKPITQRKMLGHLRWHEGQGTLTDDAKMLLANLSGRAAYHQRQRATLGQLPPAIVVPQHKTTLANPSIEESEKKSYQRKMAVTIDVWVTHRDDMGLRRDSDPDGKPWRSTVRHSNGTMEWQWHDTREQAIGWCESFAGNAPTTDPEPLEDRQ